MAEPGTSDVRRGFSRLSTAIKMFVILGLALFPLFLVAVLASVDAAKDGRNEREAAALVRSARSANALSGLIARDLLALRMTAAYNGSAAGQSCSRLERVQAAEPDLVIDRFALFTSSGQLSCTSDGVAIVPPNPLPVANETRVWLNARDRTLHFAAAVDGAFAVGSHDFATLRDVAVPAGGRDVNIRLEQGDAQMQLVKGDAPAALQNLLVERVQLAGSNVSAVLSVVATPITAVEVAGILLPLLMWLAAAMLGWLIVDRLLLRPIVKLQQAVSANRPGTELALPELMTPATEIRALGEAFVRVTQTVAVHEAELEAAIARQARLVREVHHRVKNNLQVVASLLNLHARGAKSLDAANAYATIQRRVDALAVVHRNHFAELEDDRGVALRSLLSELTGNLRATAPEGATGTAITLDLDTVFVNQDVAVSVAFFVTEIVEHAMFCTPDKPIGVTLRQSSSPTNARLILQSDSLKASADCQYVDVRQFERITTGLSRQLRAVLERDGENGIFAIDIATQEVATTSG